MAATSPTPRKWRRRFARLIKILILAGIAGLIALAVAVWIAMSSIPSFGELQRDPNGQSIRVRSSDGYIIAKLGPSYGSWLRYDEIPPVMVDAMVAVEDRRFRSHPGVDPIGLSRSLYVRIQRGKWTQGGSTITQQLARNIFLTNARTFGRKFREMILALAMERKFSKDQILELYLNKVYFGGGAYGVDAASRTFFGHDARTLSLGEAAVIAGLVKAPSNYSPTADAQAAIDRSGVVLQVMQDAGAITAAQAAAVDPKSIKLAQSEQQDSARYFTDWVLPQLETLIDESEQPIDVWTTIDRGMQRAADQAIRANAPAGTQGALVSLDRDGAVRAMVGGKDYVSSIYNRATQATRQPGSAFKLFVYLAALENGYRPDTMVEDKPIAINGWSPRNSSGRYSGQITLRTAFTYSINTVAAQIGQDVGFPAVADMARRFGISTPLNTHPSMVLGTADVRLIDMTRAYAAVARGGIGVTPYGITKVTTDKGQLLYQHRSDESRVLVAPYVAAEMTDLLQTAVSAGTGRAAQIGRPVAGKTGTTSSNKDGWFMGFSSGLTTGVWMGRDDAKRVGGLQGGTAPARAFAAFMSKAVANRPIENFQTEVTLPEEQLEPDEDAYFGSPDNGQMYVDENGNPVFDAQPGFSDPGEDIQAPQTIDEQWIDGVIGREPGQPRPRRPEDARAPGPQPAVRRPAS